MMFSLLINGEEKGNTLLLICVNLGTHTHPAAVGMGLGISSAGNQSRSAPRGRSSLRRKQDLGFRRKAVGAGLNWQGGSRPELSLHPWRSFPCPAELPRLVAHTWMGLQAGHRASSSLCRGDTQPVPLGFGDSR